MIKANSPGRQPPVLRILGAALLILGLMPALPSAAQGVSTSRNLAPGFVALPRDAKVLIAPLDVELFEVSGGGVLQPKADWTEAAIGHLKKVLVARARNAGLVTGEIDAKVAEEHAEALNLNAAVSRAIAVNRGLPTKEGRLEWSFGDALRPLQQASGARYGLFTWVRDSYATAERKAMMGVVAVLTAVATAGTSVVMLGGGVQAAYLSLVDLESGQVLWFNQLRAQSGDLRTEIEATKSMEGLLRDFPPVQ